jgi:hypothetical protein
MIKHCRAWKTGINILNFCFHILNNINYYYCKFQMAFWETFLEIGPEGKKTKTLWKIYDFLPLVKFSYIVDLLRPVPPESLILDWFLDFFVAPCHKRLINFSIESCLTFVMLVWKAFPFKKLSRKVYEIWWTFCRWTINLKG